MEIETCPKKTERISRIRRAVFSWVTTTASLGTAVYLVIAGYESGLAGKVVDGLITYAQLMAVLYLGAGVLDKSEILSRIGSK